MNIEHKTSFPKLNAAQLEAVNYTSGNLLIVASAGTGKTTTIVERYVNLVKKEKIREDEIMMTTFTNKAAKDMVKKIMLRMGKSREPPNVGTMHSLFLRLVKEHHNILGINKHFTFLDDESDKKRIVKRILAAEGINPLTDNVSYFVRWIGKFKNRGILAENLSEKRTLDENISSGIIEEVLDDQVIRVDPTMRKYVNKIYKKYQHELKESNLIDFDDILLLTFKLLNENKEICSMYKNKFKSIMVDEAQDINVVQMNILLLLKNNNLCLIGDDCQNIYEWRGSSNQLVFDFSNNEKTIYLKENYRSDKKIISSVNKVIKHMRFKIDKELIGTKEGVGSIVIESFTNFDEEKDFIVYAIKKLISKETLPDNISVLFRTNRIGQELEREMRKNKLPCHLSKAKDFFEREEIKDVVSFLKLKVNPKSFLDFQRIFCILPGLSKGTAQKFREVSIKNHCSLTDSLSLAEQLKLGTDKLAQIEKLENVLKNFEKNPINSFLVDFDYLKHLNSKYNMDEDKLNDKMENIKVIEELYKEYGNSKDDIKSFLDSTLEIDKKDKTSGKVTLSTIHSAKGLEWEHVFLASCNEGTLPFYRQELDDMKRDSELRLFYVAISRAKKSLVISHYYQPDYGFKHLQRSSFIDIIDQ